MRGGSVKKFISLLCILPAILIMCGQLLYIKVEARPGHKTTLIIGDSIPYGMALGKKFGTGVDKADEVYWLTEGGVNINFLSKDFKIHMGKVMPKKIVNTFTMSRNFDLIEEVRKKKIEDIVIMLGTNWPGEKSAKLTVSTLKKLAKKSGCRIYYANVLPYVHKGRYKDRSSVMAYHNKLTREGFKGTDIIYIDACKLAKSVKNYRNCTSDGIHYSKKVYNVIFNKILSLIEKEKKAVKFSKKKKISKKLKIKQDEETKH